MADAVRDIDPLIRFLLDDAITAGVGDAGGARNLAYLHGNVDFSNGP